MTDILKNLTQEEYDKIAVEFFEETGRYHGDAYLRFYAMIHKQLFMRLTDKFASVGLRLQRVQSQAPTPEMLYRVVDDKDKVVFPNLLDFSFTMRKLIYMNHSSYGNIPDVKVVVPEYLEARVEEVASEIFNEFLAMKKQEAQQGDGQIINESEKP